MTIKPSTTEFLFLYKEIYQCLHTFWGEGEHYPSPDMLAVMNHLMKTGPLTITEAAQHFSRSQSATSELIGRLEAQGYVAKINDKRDKRRTLVWLSRNGRQVFERVQNVLDAALLNTSMSALDTQEREALLTGMRALLASAQRTLEERRKAHEQLK